MKYCQCTLSKATKTGEITDVAWIPQKFAKKNNYLEIKMHGKWVNGWKIIKTGNILEDSYIHQREYTQHRIITDK